MTLLIRNVRIVDGGVERADLVDVFVSGETISAIGQFASKTADRILDAQGAYLSPGFIDVNTDSDHYLTIFSNPEQEDFIRQGVTTIVGGLCGSSLAPLLYGGLESIQKWTDPRAMNVDWHTVKEFLALFDTRTRLGVNFCTFAGHSTIRRALLGESLRDLTKNEIGVFSETLRTALADGAYGLSTGLGYVHSRQTPYNELKALATIVREMGGVYATHIRKDGKDLGESVEETIRLQRETGVPTLISHLLPLRGSEGEYESALTAIEAEPSDHQLFFDVYPFDTSMLALYTFLPTWAQNGGVEVMYANIQDEWMRNRIAKDIPKIDSYAFTVAQAPNNPDVVGRTLRDLMQLYGTRNESEALMRLMLATKLKANVLYADISSGLINRALTSPRSLIASNAASFRYDEKMPMLKPERATRTFTRFLELVEREKLLPLPEAIAKITSTPARLLGLKNRGAVREGYIADLTCFKNGEIKFTIVHGDVAYADGSTQGTRSGRALRRT